MELLVVIAILGILMALLFPAVGAAINTAKRAQAKNDATQIATALKGYYTEYGRWPTGAAENYGDLTGLLLETIRASNNTENPRQIVFLEVNNYKKGKSGVDGSTFVDPWKQPYKVKIDADYNNKIESLPNTSTSDNATVNGTVAVWSIGVPKKGSEKNGSGYQENTDRAKYAKSWE